MLVLCVQVGALVYHILVCYVLIYHYDLQLKGVGMACSITHVSTLLFYLMYLSLSKDSMNPGSWHFYNKDSFRGIMEYLRYGLPSMLMTIFEFFCFESLMIMSGFISSDALGANIIIINIIATLYMMPLGMSLAAANLVGSNLGAGKPRNARRYAIASIILSVVFT